MELEDIMLSKISQVEKDKYHMFSLRSGSPKSRREIRRGLEVAEVKGG
jgi:hypothetical protein